MWYIYTHCSWDWAIKKAKRQRTDGFELWCWRRLLRVPWTARRSNQSILKEISPECSLEGLMLKLKLQYFDHLMQRPDSFEKTLMLRDWRQEEKGMIEDEMVGWHHQLNEQEFEQALGVGDGQGSLARYSPRGRKELDTTEWLNWTDIYTQWNTPVQFSYSVIEYCSVIKRDLAICNSVNSLGGIMLNEMLDRKVQILIPYDCT